MAWYINGVLFSGPIVTVGSGKDYANPATAMSAATADTLILIYDGSYSGGISAWSASYNFYFKGMGASPDDVVISGNLHGNLSNDKLCVFENMSVEYTTAIIGAYSTVFSKCHLNAGSHFRNYSGTTDTPYTSLVIRQCQLDATDTWNMSVANFSKISIQKTLTGIAPSDPSPSAYAENDYVLTATAGYGTGSGTNYINLLENLSCTIPETSFNLTGYAPSLPFAAISCTDFTLTGYGPGISGQAQFRYWVPKAAAPHNAWGYFDETYNWALTSGGTPGASIPGGTDIAVFDANSCPAGTTLPFEVVINHYEVLCDIRVDNDLVWFSIEDEGRLSLRRPLRCSGVQTSQNHRDQFGVPLYDEGIFETNNYDISVSLLRTGRDSVLGSSTITIGEVTDNYYTRYPDIACEHTEDVTIILYANNGTNDPDLPRYAYFDCAGPTGQMDVHLIAGDIFQPARNSFIFGQLSITGDGTVLFSGDGYTDITITDPSGLILEGATPGGLVLETYNHASNWLIHMSEGDVDAVNCSIADSIADGGATFRANLSDGGGNTGWLFGSGIVAAAGHLTITGILPSLLFPVCPIVAEHLALTAYVPLSLALRLSQPPTGNIVLSGLAPSWGDHAAAIDVTSLLFTGYNPLNSWAPSGYHRFTYQMIYLCILTGAADGLPDLTIPMSSFQSTMRNGDPSYLACVLPNSIDYAAEIAARTNGDIVVHKGFRFSDGSTQTEEICRVSYESLQINRGSHNDSATISGHKTTTSTASSTRVLTDVSYYGLQVDGKHTFRSEPDLFLRVGDIATYGEISMEVGQISYMVDSRMSIMQVTEA